MIRKTILVGTAAATMVLLLNLAQAQVQVSPALQDKPAEESVAAENRLVLYGAKEPDPILRYRFWPEPSARRNENATPLVSRAVILMLQVSPDTRKHFGEKFQEWNEMSIDELPVEEVRKLLGFYQAALGELQRAEHLMGIDYPLQLDELSASELVQTLLPEFQEMRDLARLLSLKARLAIREQRWDDMVNDCRVGFRLAEVAGRSTDFLIGRLVGFAIAGTMMDVIETAIQQPGCPNLYWALASVPADRLFETREALESESILISRLFSGVGTLPDEPIGAVAAREKLRVVLDQANESLFEARAGASTSATAELLGGGYIVMMADPSRDLLAGTPQWGERAYQLSAPEAVLRATILKFQRERDRWVAWTLLPQSTSSPGDDDLKAIYAPRANESDPLVSLVSLLTPAVEAAVRAGRRSEQYLHWLLTIEAVRMHAAQTGQLPVSIDRLRPVPAWSDSLSSGPFGYQRSTTNQATLTRSPRYSEDTETTCRIVLKEIER